MNYSFSAEIYTVGVNWCVDVPKEIIEQMVPDKGRIFVRGQVNGFDFSTTLMHVKGGPYRLYVNLVMMKGGKTAVGRVAFFVIEQHEKEAEPEYFPPEQLTERLESEGLAGAFELLTPTRKKAILKYLNFVKTEETLQRNIDKLVVQLKNNEKNVRVP